MSYHIPELKMCLNLKFALKLINRLWFMKIYSENKAN